MKTYKLLIFAFLPFFLFLNSYVLAQGWEKVFDYYYSDIGNSVHQTIDSGYIIAGSSGDGGVSNDVYAIKTDVNGTLQWERTYGGNGNDIGNMVRQTNDNGYIIVGYTNSFGYGGKDVYLIKINAFGDTLWTKTYGGTADDFGNSVQQTTDGGYIIGGYTLSYGAGLEDMYLIRTDATGEMLWSKTIGSDSTDICMEAVVTSDGGLILGGYTKGFGASYEDIFLVKTNISGDTLWTRKLGGYGYDFCNSVKQTTDGGFILTGRSPGSDLFAYKTDVSGNILWTKDFGTPYGVQFGNSVALTSDGGYVLAGTGVEPGSSDYYVYLIRIDIYGDTICTNKFGGYVTEHGNEVQQTSEGGFIIAGTTYSFGNNPYNVYLIKTDNVCQALTNSISGTVFVDPAQNCLPDSNDFKLKGWLIKMQPGPRYALTDSLGNYNDLADTGAFSIEELIPNSYWKQICPYNPEFYSDYFQSFYSISDSNHFANQILIYCPYMVIDIGASNFRPCSTSVFSVHYCNNGTIPADSAYIEIEFDDDISPISSTLPWTSVIGNVYTFNIGTVGVSQCGTFYITADVSCSAVLGSTHCVLAHIYPDSICTPVDTAWDKSSVMVEGICTDDSLACFTIYNTGEDMAGTSQWRIYENNVLIETGSFQLNAGDSLVMCRPANGQTIRLEADQRPGHPGSSHPNANVEMCGGFAPASLGMILQQPEDDFDEFVEMVCMEITSSFDPNEKLVKPSGTTANHNIDSTDVLEYQINFQNTGTDTAFRVVIRDTLSQKLDITTVQSGASSHPYSFRIYGHGILEWTFSNILLPDSNVNEPMSHGFVRYKVNQNAGNTLGTVIENRAAIYFDYNAPVITNTAFNTVWKEQVLSVQKIFEENMGIVVYPHPFNESFIIEIVQSEFSTNNVQFSMFNLLGELVLYSGLQKGKTTISRKNLPPGIYIYKVFDGDALIGAGKLVAE